MYPPLTRKIYDKSWHKIKESNFSLKSFRETRGKYTKQNVANNLTNFGFPTESRLKCMFGLGETYSGFTDTIITGIYVTAGMDPSGGMD